MNELCVDTRNYSIQDFKTFDLKYGRVNFPLDKCLEKKKMYHQTFREKENQFYFQADKLD